jgi:hypothetical protein
MGYINLPKIPTADTPLQGKANLYVDLGGDLVIKKDDGVEEKIGKNGNNLVGSNYVLVAATGSPQENAEEFIAKYEAIRQISPTEENIITIMLGSGYYSFPSNLVLDVPNVIITSLSGLPDIVFDFFSEAEDKHNVDGFYPNEGIRVIGDNIILKNLNLRSNGVGFAIYFATNLNGVIVISVSGGDYCFNVIPDETNSSTLKVKFISCSAGDNSFGHKLETEFLIMDGFFENCLSGDNSFGHLCKANTAKFISCSAGNNSFNYNDDVDDLVVDEGSYLLCTAGENSFGYCSSIGGSLSYCTAGDNSFGHEIVKKADINHCIGGDNSFGLGGLGESVLKYCVLKGDNSFKISDATILLFCVEGNKPMNIYPEE